MRKKLLAEGIEYTVAKKTLIRKGLESIKAEDIEKIRAGRSGGPSSSVTTTRWRPRGLTQEFGKTNDKVQIVGGVMNMAVMDAASMKQIASLPGKDQLRAQLVYTINAPVSGFVQRAGRQHPRPDERAQRQGG